MTQQPPIILNGRGKPILVSGKEKSPLTTAQYNVVAALLEAGRATLIRMSFRPNLGTEMPLGS